MYAKLINETRLCIFIFPEKCCQTISSEIRSHSRNSQLNVKRARSRYTVHGNCLGAHPKFNLFSIELAASFEFFIQSALLRSFIESFTSATHTHTHTAWSHGQCITSYCRYMYLSVSAILNTLIHVRLRCTNCVDLVDGQWRSAV